MNIHKRLVECFENECRDDIRRQKDSWDKDQENEAYVCLPYAWKAGQKMVKKLICSLRRKPVNFITMNNTEIISTSCHNEDCIPDHLKSPVIYQMTCPACKQSFIGETHRCYEF